MNCDHKSLVFIHDVKNKESACIIMNCSCSEGMLHGWFQVEVFGKGGKQEVGFALAEIEER